MYINIIHNISTTPASYYVSIGLLDLREFSYVDTCHPTVYRTCIPGGFSYALYAVYAANFGFTNKTK